MNEKITLFLDTNIFLHYQYFDQIDWAKLFGITNVEIIIPPITINELNTHKDSHSKPKIRARASDIIKKLFKLFENMNSVFLKENLSIRLEDREPEIDFPQHQLSWAVNDDHLIASILYCRMELPEEKVVLVTSDYGLLLGGKAKRQNIEVFPLPDLYKIPEESDPNEKKIAELQAKLQKFENSRPNVLLIFSNDEDHIRFPLERPKPDLTSADIERMLEKVKNDHPFMQNIPPTPKTKNLNDILAASFDTINNKDIDVYNQELKQYYSKSEATFQKYRDYENLLARTLVLDILVSNRGTEPADDIDISMHFADGFILFSEEKFPRVYNPQPPSKPQTTSEKMKELNNLHQVLSNFDTTQTPPNVSRLDIRQTNSYDVRFHINRLKHNLKAKAHRMYITFSTYDDAKSFEINYKILVANLPEPVTGKLRVVVEKQA